MMFVKGYMAKNRSCDAESIHVDEEPPTVYFDPQDPTIGIGLCSQLLRMHHHMLFRPLHYVLLHN